MKKIRVIYIIGSLELGGTERHLCRVLPDLIQHGILPTVFTVSRAGPLATSLKDNGVPVYSNFFSNQIANWPTILKYVVILITTPFAIWYYTIRQRAQVIHFYLPEAYIVGGFSSLFLPYLKRIMSRRSLNNYQKNRPFLIYLELLLHKTIHLFTANSTVVAQQLQKEHILPKKIKLIYNGIENLDLGNNPPKAFSNQFTTSHALRCKSDTL